MVVKTEKQLTLCDYTSPQSSFSEDVIKSLSKKQKEIPCKYLYDSYGSLLFERICSLKDYYPTRVETEILRSSVSEMATLIGENAVIVEYGSGASTKTKILLDALKNPKRYVPIDISKEQLTEAGSEIARKFSPIDVCCICADYLGHYYVPLDSNRNDGVTVFFPGSTIGNFMREQAVDFLKRVLSVCGRGGALIIGVDLAKDTHILERAYNDEEGVTELFNKNLLTRMNNELGFDFDIESFSHKAVYNKDEGCIEMYLVSGKAQYVTGGGSKFQFEKGESILTERSYKYKLEDFGKIAWESGFRAKKIWTDENKWFSLQYLVRK